jgi:hypothetical protein
VLVRQPPVPASQGQDRKGQVKWETPASEDTGAGSSAVPDRPSGGRSLLARLALKKLASSKDRAGEEDKVGQ